LNSRTIVACIVAIASALRVADAVADVSLTVGDVSWTQSATHATLANTAIVREWTIAATATGDSVATTRFGRPDGPNLVSPPSRELTLGFGPVAVDSSELRLASLSAVPVTNGIKATFSFVPLPVAGLPAGVSIDREITLYAGVGVFDVVTKVHNVSPVPLVVSSYSLDELRPADPAAAAEVQAYVGGSDWRDDFRHVKTETGAFDDEGEVARFGTDAGWFFVSERRGGAASRVGRDDTRTWAGADFARDLLDLGPLATSPPSYNRLENPVYPLPLRFRTITPFSDFTMGRVATGVYAGGAEQAPAAYVSYLVGHRQAPFPRQVLLNSFHPWGHGADFDEATMQTQADVAADLGIDTIVLDDQWQGGAGGESGDWQWDTTRFPDRDGDGKGDIADYFAAKGLKLGLWMSPAEFNGASVTFHEHPEWACIPTGIVTSQIPDDAGLGVWDMTNPNLRAYLTSVVDRAVESWGVRYFKFDFQTWVDCPPHDYNDYEDAFAAWVESLKSAHPEVTFTFDETNDQRMYAFESVARGPSWFDNAHGHALPDGTAVSKPAQILHDVWMAAPWVPPSTLGIGLFDSGTLDAGYAADFLLPAALLTHVTFWKDLTKIGDDDKATTMWWLQWYHQHASELGGLVYRLSDADPWDGTAAAVFQPWNPLTDSGFLFAFRQAGGAPAAPFQGLVPAHRYTVTAVRDGSLIGSFTAEELAGGALDLSAMGMQTAAVYSILPE
jgi:Melibiase